jgi:phosphoglycerate dehydrogenase-like enzyme
MSDNDLPLVISAPEPRTLELIFTPPALDRLKSRYRIIEADPNDIAALPADQLAAARYVVGQPALSRETLEAMTSLRCIFNVETNLLDNMPYDYLFERGIHVVTTGLVFAEPVAEMGLAMALNLARDIVESDLAFRHGMELWGGDGNKTARLGCRPRSSWTATSSR